MDMSKKASWELERIVKVIIFPWEDNPELRDRIESAQRELARRKRQQRKATK